MFCGERQRLRNTASEQLIICFSVGDLVHHHMFCCFDI